PLRRGLRLHGGRHVVRRRRACRSRLGERRLRPADSARPRSRPQTDRSARRPAETYPRDLPDRPSLVGPDLPLQRPAIRRLEGGGGSARRGGGGRRSVPQVGGAGGVGRGGTRAAVLTAARVKVPPEPARRFLVARHFLAPARSLAAGPDSVLEVIRKLGSIQF